MDTQCMSWAHQGSLQHSVSNVNLRHTF